MLGPLVLLRADRTRGVTLSSSDELNSSYRATETDQLGLCSAFTTKKVNYRSSGA